MDEEKIGVLSAVQVRLGRPTNRLDEMLRFYCDGLGLSTLMQFDKDQAGYAGVVLGVPGTDCHLEFVTHENGFSDDQIAPPSEDHLLVLYLEDLASHDQITGRLREMGFQAAAAKNPHWDKDGTLFKDPDGWGVVLMFKRNV